MGSPEYQPLEQSLVEEVPAATDVTVEAVPTIEVVAPATLPEGYHFEAKAGDRMFMVTVPLGGVEAGQKFTVPISDGAIASNLLNARMSVPVGAWRDGLLDCFKFGPMHPTCLVAYCCPSILNAQVMTRLKLDWLGNTVRREGIRSNAFRINLLLVGIFFTIKWCLSSWIQKAFNEEGQVIDNNLFFTLYAIATVLNTIFGAYVIIMVAKVRKFIRSKYAIPESGYCFHGCEDFCCSFWCNCCVVAQMSRHTADFDTYRATLCSETGLGANAPDIV